MCRRFNVKFLREILDVIFIFAFFSNATLKICAHNGVNMDVFGLDVHKLSQGGCTSMGYCGASSRKAFCPVCQVKKFFFLLGARLGLKIFGISNALEVKRIFEGI